MYNIRTDWKSWYAIRSLVVGCGGRPDGCGGRGGHCGVRGGGGRTGVVNCVRMVVVAAQGG